MRSVRIVGRNYGPSRIVNFVNFGENVKSSGSRVPLDKILFSFIVYEVVVEHAFDVFRNSFLYSASAGLEIPTFFNHT